MIFVVLIAAIAGGLVGVKFKLPAGALLGSMAGAVLANLVFNCTVSFPPWVKFFTQVSTGAFVGAKITKRDVLGLKRIFAPAVVLSACMLFFSIFVSFLCIRLSDITLETALFGTAPAGVTDMTLASMDFNAEPAKVALLQIVRLLSVLSFMPGVTQWINKKITNGQTPKRDQNQCANVLEHTFADTLKTLSVALCFGGVGFYLGVPAGTISFSMIGCALYNIKFHKAYVPLRLRQWIQFAAGALIGAMVTRAQLLEMFALWPVVLVVMIGFLALNFTAAFLIIKLTHMEPITALLASSAGGLTDMAIIADELGADASKVAAMQLVRVVSVIAFYPIIIRAIVR